MTAATQPHIAQVDPRTAQSWLDSGSAVLVDVREPSEHRAAHIAGSCLVPLSRFDPEALPVQAGKKVILHCRSGRRSMTAAQRLAAAGIEDVASLAGGIDAWTAAGLPTVCDSSAPIDVMRQTQIVIGTFVLAGVLLGVLVSPWFLILSGFMGAGLIFAGSTGWCGMAMFIARMPWNRAS